jgi:hypothetical protein
MGIGEKRYKRHVLGGSLGEWPHSPRVETFSEWMGDRIWDVTGATVPIKEFDKNTNIMEGNK